MSLLSGMLKGIGNAAPDSGADTAALAARIDALETGAASINARLSAQVEELQLYVTDLTERMGAKEVEITQDESISSI